jgi:hypothetical protein
LIELEGKRLDGDDVEEEEKDDDEGEDKTPK